MSSKYGHLTGDQVEALLNRAGGKTKIPLLLQGMLKVVLKPNCESFPLTVDLTTHPGKYPRWFASKIASGGYEKVNEEVTAKNFPRTLVPDISHVRAYLVRFPGVTTAADVVTTIKVMGLQPGKIEHLLEFGMRYRPLIMKRDLSILALGSLYDDQQEQPSHRLAPWLFGSPSYIRIFTQGASSNCAWDGSRELFLAVKERSKKREKAPK